MATYIYCRVSTEDQKVDAQTHTITQKYPDAEVISETTSGYKEKPALNALLARLRRGDTLVVAALDRLGRHAWKAIKLIEDLTNHGVTIISLREKIDTSDPASKFTVTMMLALAEMERDIISARTKDALAAKKASGMKLGRPRKDHTTILAKIAACRSRGLSMADTAKEVGISAGRVCQLLKPA